jgi:hypothetical protein
MFDHVPFDQLSIKHCFAHDASDETEVDKMVVRAGDFFVSYRDMRYLLNRGKTIAAEEEQ